MATPEQKAENLLEFALHIEDIICRIEKTLALHPELLLIPARDQIIEAARLLQSAKEKCERRIER